MLPHLTSLSGYSLNYRLTGPFQVYLWVWTHACVVALGLFLGTRRMRAEVRPYVRFVTMLWKVAVFAPAGLFVTFAGQYAYDDTWDIVSGAGMSILTYMTAPWAVGTLYLAGAGRRNPVHAFVALVAALFSASWFYDGWLLLRDHVYPDMWLPNLLLSPFLYAAAGFLWNLEVDAGGKPTLGFLRPDWPAPPTVPQFRPKLALVAVPPIAVAAAILLLAVRWNV